MINGLLHTLFYLTNNGYVYMVSHGNSSAPSAPHSHLGHAAIIFTPKYTKLGMDSFRLSAVLHAKIGLALINSIAPLAKERISLVRTDVVCLWFIGLYSAILRAPKKFCG